MKRVFLLLLLACCLLIAPAAAAGGSGTAADPYIVQTAAELQSIQNNLAAYYKLANDINLQGVSFTPIGSTSSPFTGSFDGAGYTISNLVISSSTPSTGFFSCLGSGVIVKDIVFQDCMISCSHNWVGVLTGSIFMSSSINNAATINDVDVVRCTVSIVDPDDTGYNIGGIIGLVNYNSIVKMSNCDVISTYVENKYTNAIGGLIGGMTGQSSLEVNSCSVQKSMVIGGSPSIRVGSVVGAITGTSIINIEDVDVENCVFKSGSICGGIIGNVYGGTTAHMIEVTVKNCVIFTSNNYAGGLVGLVTETDSSISSTNCIVSDSTIVATANYAGGVCGRIDASNTGLFDNCIVSDCTILTNTYAAGVCPAYS